MLFSPLLLVCAASFLVYYNSLDGGLVFDDHRAILTNDDLDPAKTSIVALFHHDFWGGEMSRRESHKSYRPLTVLTYRYFNYWIAGLEPYGYHLVNVLMHCAASVLFLWLCQILLGPSGSKWSSYAAVLFAVHSIHTEAVSSVVGRAEVLSCIFFLASLLLYSKAVSSQSACRLRPRSVTNWVFFSLSVLSSVCAMLSKEQGVMAVGVCASFDVLLHWEVLVKQCRGSFSQSQSCAKESELSNGASHETCNGKTRKTSDKLTSEIHSSSLPSLMKRLGILVMCGAMLMWFRLSMNYSSSPIFKAEELLAAFHPNRSVRILSFSNIYVINTWLLLNPYRLCCDWSLGSVPLVTTLSDVKNIASLFLYISFIVLAIHTLLSKRDRLVVGMALSLLLLPFLPASGLIFQVGFVIAERVLYMPSLGFCLLVTIGARRLNYSHQRLQRVIEVFMVYLLVVLTARTLSRNQDWASDLNLFKSGVTANPTNVKIRNNYGMELKAANQLDQAREQYKRALEIDPDYVEVYFNLGNLLSDEGNYTEALKNFEAAIEHPQMYAKTLNNLATTYFRLGHWAQAEERFLESIQLQPDQAPTYNNLASLYGETKRYQESEEMFKKSLQLNPTYTEAYFNLGTLMVQMGRLDEAESHLKHALRLNPGHHGAANNLKVVHHHREKKTNKKHK